MREPTLSMYGTNVIWYDGEPNSLGASPCPRSAQRGCGRAYPCQRSESDAEQEVEAAKEGRDRRMPSKKGGKWGKLAEQPTTKAMRWHSEKRACPRKGEFKPLLRRDYAVAKPSQTAKPSGTPKSVIVTPFAVGTRALRASRSPTSSR